MCNEQQIDCIIPKGKKLHIVCPSIFIGHYTIIIHNIDTFFILLLYKAKK